MTLDMFRMLLLLIVVIAGYWYSRPFTKLLRRRALPPWLAILLFIPLINLCLLFALFGREISCISENS